MNLKDKVADLLMRRPALYDMVKLAKRKVTRDNDGLYKLLSAFSKMNENVVTFVQVGANDGLRNDPIREFIVNNHWSGLLIEPIPASFAELKKNYAYLKRDNLSFLCCAIGSSEAGLVLYTINQNILSDLPAEKRLNYLRKASTSKAHLERFVPETLHQHIVESVIESTTIESALERCLIQPSAIDVIVIDVEGYEFEILQGIDWSILKPKMVVYESIHLGLDQVRLATLLEGNGYTIKTVGPDSIACKGDGLKAVKLAGIV